MVGEWLALRVRSGQRGLARSCVLASLLLLAAAGVVLWLPFTASAGGAVTVQCGSPGRALPWADAWAGTTNAVYNACSDGGFTRLAWALLFVGLGLVAFIGAAWAMLTPARPDLLAHVPRWARMAALSGAFLLLGLVVGVPYLFGDSWAWVHFRLVGLAVEAAYCLPVFLYLQHRWAPPAARDSASPVDRPPG